MGIKAFISQSVCKVCVGAVVGWGRGRMEGEGKHSLSVSLSHVL